MLPAELAETPVLAPEVAKIAMITFALDCASGSTAGSGGRSKELLA